MDFGEKIKSLRQERSWTQPQLAQEMGVEQSYLSKLENGKSIPSPDTFSLLMRVFEQRADELLADVNSQFVRDKLAHIPAVASVVNSRNSKVFFQAKRWLLVSAALCVLGIGIFFAAHYGWLFPERVYNYRSSGVVLAGEPGNVFETQLNRSGTGDAFLERQQELANRLDESIVTTYQFRGMTFEAPVEGGTRRYELIGQKLVDRSVNRYLRFVAVLLFASGLFGFLLNYQLASLSRKIEVG